MCTNLGVLEGLGGQHTAAIAALEKAMDYQKATIPKLSGIRMTIGRLLVGYYATAGNFSASKQTLDELENNIKQLKNAQSYYQTFFSFETFQKVEDYLLPTSLFLSLRND